jgi:hypothetical protein
MKVCFTTLHQFFLLPTQRLFIELDLQSLFGLLCIHWMRALNSPPPPHLGSHIRAPYWSAKIDDISMQPPGQMFRGNWQQGMWRRPPPLYLEDRSHHPRVHHGEAELGGGGEDGALDALAHDGAGGEVHRLLLQLQHELGGRLAELLALGRVHVVNVKDGVQLADFHLRVPAQAVTCGRENFVVYKLYS